MGGIVPNISYLMSPFSHCLCNQIFFGEVIDLFLKIRTVCTCTNDRSFNSASRHHAGSFNIFVLEAAKGFKIVRCNVIGSMFRGSVLFARRVNFSECFVC